MGQNFTAGVWFFYICFLHFLIGFSFDWEDISNVLYYISKHLLVQEKYFKILALLILFSVLVSLSGLILVQIAADNNRDEDSFNNFNKIAILKIKVQMKDLWAYIPIIFGAYKKAISDFVNKMTKTT